MTMECYYLWRALHSKQPRCRKHVCLLTNVNGEYMKLKNLITFAQKYLLEIGVLVYNSVYQYPIGV